MSLELLIWEREHAEDLQTNYQTFTWAVFKLDQKEAIYCKEGTHLPYDLGTHHRFANIGVISFDTHRPTRGSAPTDS